MNEISQREKKAEDVVDWHSDHEIIYAVWSLVRMCGSDDANGIRALVSDFVSRVLWLAFAYISLYDASHMRVD